MTVTGLQENAHPNTEHSCLLTQFDPFLSVNSNFPGVYTTVLGVWVCVFLS